MIKKLLFFLMLGLLLVGFWAIDARDNRIEANVLMVCQHEMGPGHCYHGSWTDPYPGWKSS